MFIAYEVSLEVIKSLRPVVPLIERHDRDLADQLKRAASSVSLNLAEGQRLTKGNKPKHYAIAHGSANEVRAALQTALAWGLARRCECGVSASGSVARAALAAHAPTWVMTALRAHVGAESAARSRKWTGCSRSRGGSRTMWVVIRFVCLVAAAAIRDTSEHRTS